jgi:hypothetical protein
MKFQPTGKSKPARPKIPYIVIIEESTYHTSAYNEEAALSNAAYRYAEENDEEVGLIMWKIKQDKLYSNVEEG